MKAKLLLALGLAFAGTAAAQVLAVANPAKPAMPAVCGTCHNAAPGAIRGYFENVAFKSSAIQLSLGTATEILRFEPKTIKVVDAGVAKPAEHLYDVRKGHEARIEFTESGGIKTATAIAFKGPIKTAPEKLLSYLEVEKLVKAGPERASYTLIDSRPLVLFQQGTIPSAINLPFPAFDKFVARLPADKAKLLVFFCQGPTCMMSPSSLARAEALGYTNVKVYREGWPEWTRKSFGVVTAESLKEAFIDKGIAHVLIDARAAGEARRTGFIPGAVEMPAPAVKSALKDFPDKALKAPILIYDASSGDEAVEAAKALVAAGYEKVLVVAGGLAGWQSAGYALATGDPALGIAYAPKPRSGSLPVEEFRKIALDTPADTLILDVRNRDEANEGMIKGALLLPEDEILARLAEIPADKRVVTLCSTGVRAEMAYHKLKEKGYKVAFVNAEVDIAKDGSFAVTPN